CGPPCRRALLQLDSWRCEKSGLKEGATGKIAPSLLPASGDSAELCRRHVRRQEPLCEMDQESGVCWNTYISPPDTISEPRPADSMADAVHRGRDFRGDRLRRAYPGMRTETTDRKSSRHGHEPEGLLGNARTHE